MCEFMKSEPFMGSKENIIVCHYDENNLDSCAIRMLFEGSCPTLSEDELNNKEEINAKSKS